MEHAVIVRGRATPFRPDAELGGELATAFAAKYPNYVPKPASWDGGGLIRIDPETVLAWHDMPTATRRRMTARPGDGQARGTPSAS